MKIISKFKDYYDYLAGAKYGVDEKVVYDRTQAEITIDDYTKFTMGHYNVEPWEDTIYSFAICGEVYNTLYHKSQWFAGEEAAEIWNKKQQNHYAKRTWGRSYWDTQKWLMDRNPNSGERLETWLNEKYGHPVLLIKAPAHSYYTNQVILGDYGIPKILTAEDIYLKIYSFLTREPDIEDTRTDKEKIQSHGMDTKRSFRPKIKK